MYQKLVLALTFANELQIANFTKLLNSCYTVSIVMPHSPQLCYTLLLQNITYVVYIKGRRTLLHLMSVSCMYQLAGAVGGSNFISLRHVCP